LKQLRICPVAGSALPIIVISHDYAGKLTNHRDTAETLANAGFVVAAIIRSSCRGALPFFGT
jgi:predicted dienelactone hydrolase